MYYGGKKVGRNGGFSWKFVHNFLRYFAHRQMDGLQRKHNLIGRGNNSWETVFEGEVEGAEADVVSGDQETDDRKLWEVHTGPRQGAGAWNQEWTRPPDWKQE